MPGTRKLGRPTAHRNLMLRGMVTNLLQHGSMETTLTRAKEVRALTEKMITLGKRGNLAARRQALAFITKEDTVKKLFDQIAPSFEDRNGGYTVIYRLGPRRGDGAEMALIRLTPTKAEEAPVEETAKGKSKRKAGTKIEEPKAKAAPKKATPKPKADVTEEVASPVVEETEETAVDTPEVEPTVTEETEAVEETTEEKAE